jgi:hypothetical protein
MFIWDQSSGTLTRNGKIFAHGYSGADWGKNNPAAQEAKGIGPLPRGDWTITSVKDSQNTGPFTIVLEPCAETLCFGRSAFRIHGDSLRAPGTASHGCVILPRHIREAIWSSGDRLLRVVE